METITLVLCLAVGIAAVPIPDPELVATPAGPVIVLASAAPLRTNAVESYVVIDEEQGKNPETEMYTVYFPLSAELSLLDYSVQDPTEHSEPAQHVEPVGDPAPLGEPESNAVLLAEHSEEEAAPATLPAPQPPSGAKQEASSSTSSSSSQGIMSWLNPFHLPIPSIPSASSIPFIHNIPGFSSIDFPKLPSLPNIPIQWPSWLPRPGGSSSSKYMALRAPYYVYYAN